MNYSRAAEFLIERLVDLSDLRVDEDAILLLEELTTGATYCNKTGRIVSIINDLDLVELHELYSFNESNKLNINALQYALQQHCHTAWLNTSPEQLTVHLKVNPVDFFCYASKRLFSLHANDYDIHLKISELNSQLRRRCQNPETAIVTKNHLVLINEKLRRILSMVGKKELRTNIKTQVNLQLLNVHYLDKYETQLDLVLGEVGKLYTTRYGSEITNNLIHQKREKLGGDTSVAMTYNRETTNAKRKWLQYLSTEDNFFSSKVYDTILSTISADLLLMPSNDKHFIDVKITSTKIDTIKKRLNKFLDERDIIAKKTANINEALNVLNSLDLGEF
jgi:hypothetical protein